MKITRVEVKNYRGIAHKSFDVGTGGAIIKGKNGSGKTSLKAAIESALAANGIGSECIHQGSEKCEIIVDLDKARVKRSITASGSTLTVVNSEGDKWGKPQTRLDDLFGKSIDPLAFYLASPKERKKIILEASPISPLTPSDLERWGVADGPVPPANGNGLDSVESLREHYYDLRTVANKAAKDAKQALDTAEKEAKEAGEVLPKGLSILPTDKAREALKAASDNVEALNSQRLQAAAQEERSKGTREKIKELRERAAVLKAAPDFAGPSEDEIERLNKKCEETSKALKAAKDADTDACNALVFARARQSASVKLGTEVAFATVQAADLESSLASVAIATVTDAEMETANENARKAKQDLALSESALKAQNLALATGPKRTELKQREDEAERLNKIVNTLTNVAPKDLIERSGGIPGLAFAGDLITFDGVPIDNLCGAEQIKVCVDIAKRQRPAGKLLVVDKLEQLDAENMAEFIKIATSDGWQVIGTRVESGELVVEAIEGDDTKEDSQ